MNKKVNLFFLLVISVVFSSVITGCAALAIGAVATAAGTAAVVATDPRNSGTVFDDNTISTKIQNKISDNFPDSNVYVTCYNQVVLLTGQIVTQKDKENAFFIAKTIPGVQQIYNYIDVRLPQSFSSKATDSYTTTQIKTKLLGMDNIDSNNIKIVTTNSIVYLLGIVSKKQAKEVSNVAASINGVAKVITLFEYKA